jgi:hypothetical protein
LEVGIGEAEVVGVVGVEGRARINEGDGFAAAAEEQGDGAGGERAGASEGAEGFGVSAEVAGDAEVVVAGRGDVDGRDDFFEEWAGEG